MRALKRLLLSVLFLGLTLFANDVGTITAINGLASIQRGGVSIKAALGAKVQEKDRIITQERSNVQIIFNDETIISIGNNSDFSINDYLFEDTKEPVAGFGMIKGAMRVITGKIAKVAPEKFTVQTKTATIGIRGTNFTLIVNEDGSHIVYCTFGAISVTFDNQVYIVKQGFMIYITSDGKVEIREFTLQDLKDLKSKNFAFSNKGNNDALNSDEVAENDSQLDTTTMNDSTIEVKDITDSWADSSQANSSEGVTDNAVIAGYSMSAAKYTGDYTTSSRDPATGFSASGYAELNVNFNADSAILDLKASAASATDAQFEFATGEVNKNTISGTAITGTGPGSADGTFYGTTGNTVKGNFKYDDNGVSIGTYSVNSSQTLH